ncbi:anti-sigma factor [Chryseobacterium indoltheticum]|uniref:Anti-sigma-K factor RskA n=1 Tax=Chryseobacterium indoltheticum TaxID=254 RepID=A0A381JQG0_9FLAO|nr:anti-sigma factor [Chryseobacterium indoltheticum]AZA75551.1 anti-sigma factor [Chryseobacterium indoltheticum]SIR36214.1 Anti-sigma-K factor RskA [Chryseobacterium indoltheticum]SUY53672.1 putative anti-sigmaE protein [Chryseobacterium indoltheticum]
MDSKEYISSGILESYILGHASPEEAGILECVMKNNAEVKAAYEEAQNTFELLATAQAVTPPNDLKSKIWDKIQLEQNVEDEKPVIPLNNVEPKLETQQIKTQERKIEKSNGWKNFAVAATVLFLVSVGANLYWMSSQNEMKNELAVLKSDKQSQNLAMQNLEQKLKITSNPNMLKIVLAGVEKHPESNAVVYWDKTSKDVYLTANSLPKAPEGMQYQLWAIADGKPVSAGMYTDDKDAKIALANIPSAQAFAITLEKEGGSEIPTMENMYVMGGV